MDEHVGPITNWEEFECYPWPDLARGSTRSLEWYETNLPDEMCVVAFGGFGHLAEDVCLPGGGYCLGSGNSIANYVPVDNYLAMLDEGRRYCA